MLALLMGWAFPAFADVAVPPLTGRVVDMTGTLSADDIAAQSQRLKDLQTRKGSQVAVLIVPTTQPETIEQCRLPGDDPRHAVGGVEETQKEIGVGGVIRPS